MGRLQHYSGALGRALGLGGEVIITTEDEGCIIHLPCSMGHTAQFCMGHTALPPEVVKKKLRQQNWGVGKRIYCPRHNLTKKNIGRIAKRILSPLQENEEMAVGAKQEATQAPAPAAPTSEEARAARRLAHMLIEERFDVERGAYQGGYSDRRVADETGVSEHFVTKRREEEFGPLKEPPEIAQAKAELEDLHRRVIQLEEHCAKTVENMNRDIAAHRQRLGSLVAKNGWAQ